MTSTGPLVMKMPKFLTIAVILSAYGCGSLVDPNPTYSIPRAVPAPVTAAMGLQFTEIASGFFHNCALDKDGHAWCWGSNQFGELGDGVIGNMLAAGGARSHGPVAVKGGYKFRSIATGSGFTCGVTTDGDALCWGNNHVGELGFGEFSPPQSTPRVVSGGQGYTSVSGGAAATCALAPGGKAMCWGGNWFGSLGDGTSTAANTGTERSQPGPVKTTSTFTSISVGGSHVCALTAQQTLKCWGDRARGQMGDGRP